MNAEANQAPAHFILEGRGAAAKPLVGLDVEHRMLLSVDGDLKGGIKAVCRVTNGTPGRTEF